MHEQLKEIAQRLRGLRDAMDMSQEQAAALLGMEPDEYAAHENGERDFTFTFLYTAAHAFGVNLEDVLTGRSPTLSAFSIVRRGEGLKIKRRHGFKYQNMAYLFRDRMAEPFIVEAIYDPAQADQALSMSSHEGQEFDMVLQGSLRMRIDGHDFVLGEGDAVYYDSTRPHGMAATQGDCTFLAVVMRPCAKEVKV